MDSKCAIKNRTFLGIEFIALALALAAPTVLVSNATASPKAFSLSGIGSVTCAFGGGSSGLQISVPSVMSPTPVVKQNGQLIGSWSIFFHGPQIQAVGGFVQVKSSTNTFVLTGTQNDDAICGLGLEQPVTATISGQCGQGVTIQFTSPANGGERGTFTGNVVCV